MVTQLDKYLVVKGTSGMGNRILFALTAILYAQISKRKLIFDWGDSYSNDGNDVFSRFFNCPLVDPTLKVPDSKDIYPIVWRNNMHKAFGELAKEMNYKGSLNLSADLARSSYPNEIVVVGDYYHKMRSLRHHYKGEFRAYRRLDNYKILKKLLHEYLFLKNDIRETIQNFKTENFQGERVVGVHIRYTDMKSPINLIYQKIEEVIKKVKTVKLFVCTDNFSVSQEFKKRYPDAIMTDKWYPKDGTHMHQNPTCPDRTQNGIEALVDMYLLAECDYLIFDSESTFGLVSYLISDVPKKNKINIKKKKLSLASLESPLRFLGLLR